MMSVLRLILQCTLLLFCILLFNYCNNPDNPEETQPARRESLSLGQTSSASTRNDDRDDDRVDSPSSGGLRRLSDDENQEEGEYRRLRSSNFDGGDCDRDSSCDDRCDEIFSDRRARRSCGDLPKDLVEDRLHNAYQDLEDLDSSKASSLDIPAVGLIINIDPDSVTNIIDDWNKSQIKEFLLILATRKIIIDMLEDEDASFKITEAVAKRLDSVDSDINTWYQIFTTDIGSYTRTFFYYAVENNNDKAFNFVLNFFQDNSRNNRSCGDIDCVKNVFCARAEYNTRSDVRCPTTSSRRPKHCYAQGEGVWGEINFLIDDGKIDDDIQFGSKKVVDAIKDIDQDSCDDFCGDDGCVR